MTTITKGLASAAAVALAAAAPADAAIQKFTADLVTLNPNVDPNFRGGDPSGEAALTLDTDALTLAVTIDVEGVTPGMAHAQHIHGLVDPNRDSTSPLPVDAFDSDDDGFVELAEGVPAYGPVLVPLTDADGMFPVADENGTYTFNAVYDLRSAMTFADNFDREDLLPLALREIVIHGAFLPQGAGSGPGEADGTPGYKAFLPVASGDIAAVPVPGAAMLFAGGGALAAFARRRQARAAG